MKDYLVYLLTPIVGELNEIQIEELEPGENQLDLIIHAPSEYMGLLIGKQGKTIANIRQLLKVKGQLTGKRIFVKLTEDETEGESEEKPETELS